MAFVQSRTRNEKDWDAAMKGLDRHLRAIRKEKQMSDVRAYTGPRLNQAAQAPRTTAKAGKK